MNTVLKPGRIGSLTLRNRIIKTATYEGMTPGGLVGDRLVAFHRSMAKNQVGLTTVAYGAVSPQGRTFEEQLLVGPENAAGLKRIADAVHGEGGAVSLQLAHCGGFSRNASIEGGRALGPSKGWNKYGLLVGVPRIREMDEQDLERVIADFARAARIAQDAGIDAVEIHCGHGYLLSQFLSPIINRRRDEWGGDLDKRGRLAVAVVDAVRQAVGRDFPILAKVNTADGVPGGLELNESISVARSLVAAGVDCLIPSGGLVTHSPWYLMRGDVPLKSMLRVEHHWAQRWALRCFGPFVMKHYSYAPNFFLADAQEMADAVSVPVALLGGVDSAAAIDQAVDAGFEWVVMGRALLADPDFIPRLASGEAIVSRCTHCNECVAEMDRDGLRCVLDSG